MWVKDNLGWIVSIMISYALGTIFGLFIKPCSSKDDIITQLKEAQAENRFFEERIWELESVKWPPLKKSTDDLPPPTPKVVEQPVIQQPRATIPKPIFGRIRIRRR